MCSCGASGCSTRETRGTAGKRTTTAPVALSRLPTLPVTGGAGIVDSLATGGRHFVSPNKSSLSSVAVCGRATALTPLALTSGDVKGGRAAFE